MELAEKHAADFAPRVPEADRTATFQTQNLDEMKASGFTSAPVPVEFGGLGVRSVHDLALGMNRLGRTDPSTAIAINMHLSIVWAADFLHRLAKGTDNAAQTEAMAGLLQQMASGLIAAASNTEPGTTMGWPMTEATKVDEGWSLSGRKTFGTLSPAADLVLVSCRTARGDGTYESGFAIVPGGAPGMTFLDDWDTLGMRSSGSNGAVYDGCLLPESSMMSGASWGDSGGVMGVSLGAVTNLGLIAAFVGIAEAARDLAIDLARTRTKQPSGAPVAHRYGIQHAVAEMEADLATCRAHLSWAGRLLDERVANVAPQDLNIQDLYAIQGQFQCSKLVVNRKAIDVVDKALQISGGSGYFSSSPLSRMYRDVRAGPFMQPYSPNEVYEYIGQVALGLPPAIQT
ncbi:acyl-CoA dehydrogenase family protein [Frankia torreyi]|uniref:acyl-CoA dehydrogenase family protein n=1 Tax=Frankia torreyi TaxID=1856 RepID=UPI0018FE7EC7|nr:acyl-CoA dehydrogenase family protein [Frankia torreyi]